MRPSTRALSHGTRFVGFLQKQVFTFETDDDDNDFRRICREIGDPLSPFAIRFVFNIFLPLLLSNFTSYRNYRSIQRTFPPCDYRRFRVRPPVRPSPPSFMPLCRGSARARASRGVAAVYVFAIRHVPYPDNYCAVPFVMVSGRAQTMMDDDDGARTTCNSAVIIALRSINKAPSRNGYQCCVVTDNIE